MAGYTLLAAGASVSRRDVHGWDAREIACLLRHTDFLALLDEVGQQAGEGRKGPISHNFDFGPAVSFLEAPMETSLWCHVSKMRSMHKKVRVLEVFCSTCTHIIGRVRALVFFSCCVSG